MLYVPNAQGWYAYPVRTVHGALGASRPAPPVRHGRLVRVARTYQLEAARRTRQLSERLERVDRFRAVRGGSPLHLRHRPARKARLQRVRSVPRRHSQGELRALGRHRGQREQRWLQHDTRARSCRRAGRNQRTFGKVFESSQLSLRRIQSWGRNRRSSTDSEPRKEHGGGSRNEKRVVSSSFEGGRRGPLMSQESRLSQAGPFTRVIKRAEAVWAGSGRG